MILVLAFLALSTWSSVRCIKAVLRIQKSQNRLSWKDREWTDAALVNEGFWLLLTILIDAVAAFVMANGCAIRIPFTHLLGIVFNLVSVPLAVGSAAILSLESYNVVMTAVVLLFMILRLLTRLRIVRHEWKAPRPNKSLIIDLLFATFLQLSVIPPIFWSGIPD